MSTRSSVPQGKQCEMSNCLASVGACNQCLTWWQATILWWNESCHWHEQGIHWPESHYHIMGSGDNSSRSCVFFLAQVYVFQPYGSPLKLTIDLWISLQWFFWVISISSGQKPCTRIIYTISHSFLKIFFQRL